MTVQPVILAGGSGTRLWPLSRKLYPKQVINLAGERSLLQDTVLRAAAISEAKVPLLVAGMDLRFMIQDQMQGLGEWRLLLEPCARDTGAAICGAASFLAANGAENDVMLVLPADHLITGQEAFSAAVAEAEQLARAGRLVTFGLTPTRPETGFGYILATADGQVERFVEKPGLAAAQAYCQSGRYLWNSGMFAFMASVLLQEMRLHAPAIEAAMHKAVCEGLKENEHVFTFQKSAMECSPSISIDRALMEKTTRAAVVRAQLGWSDIGSWQTLWEVSDKDENGNVVKGDVLLTDVKNCLIRTDHSLLAAVGLENTLVVQSADAVLVAPLARSQEAKQVALRLKEENRPEYFRHRKVFRPWGAYTLLEEKKRFKIKRLTVNPGASLSLQRHRFRHEHWVVVSGVATVRKNDQTFFLHENEATHIPANTRHRLSNNGLVPLEIIEVQIGSYLGEDDIERLTDDYGRK